MDFLEGFFLGPIWSDTEYETRTHSGFHLFVGALIGAVFAWLAVMPEQQDIWLRLPLALCFVLFILLWLATPFMGRIYYQMPFFVKPWLLLAQLIKIGVAFIAAFEIILPKVHIDLATLPQDLMDAVNTTITEATEFFDKLGKAAGMLLGIIGGGLIIVLRLLLLLGVLILAPIALLLLIKLVQRVLDLVVQHYILHDGE